MKPHDYKEIIKEASSGNEEVEQGICKFIRLLSVYENVDDWEIIDSEVNTTNNIVYRSCILSKIKHEPLFKSVNFKTRRADIVVLRQCLIWLLRTKKGCTIVSIAKLFGLHHSTVIYSVNQFQKLLEFDKQAKKTSNECIEILNLKGYDF